MGSPDGTWEGVRVKEGNVWFIPVHASAKGTGGLVDGMLYSAVDRIYSYSLVLVAYEGYLEGRLIDPRSK